VPDLSCDDVLTRCVLAVLSSVGRSRTASRIAVQLVGPLSLSTSYSAA
jgi:hypothetical protein